MCQHCEQGDFWGDKIRVFTAKWPESTGGPAHVVLDDYNIDSTEWCLALTEAIINGKPNDGETDEYILKRYLSYSDHNRDELEATRDFLKELMVTEEPAQYARVD